MQASTFQIASGQHQSVYGALPMSYVPSYNGYGYRVCGFSLGKLPHFRSLLIVHCSFVYLKKCCSPLVPYLMLKVHSFISVSRSCRPPGPFGFVRYRLPQLQNRPTFPNLIPTANHVRALRGVVPDLSPGTAPSNYAPNYISSPYPATPGVHYPRTYNGGILNTQQFRALPTLSRSNSSNQIVATSSARTSSEVHIEVKTNGEG